MIAARDRSEHHRIARESKERVDHFEQYVAAILVGALILLLVTP